MSLSIGIEAKSRVKISKDKMLIFKKPPNPMGLPAHLSRPCFQFLKDNVSLADLSSENIFSDVIELCLAGKKCQQLELRKSLRQPKWRNVALFTEFAVKSFGNGKIIGTINKKLKLKDLKDRIQTLTGIPRSDQVLLDDKGAILDKEQKLSNSTTDVYFIALRPRKELEDIATKWGIKQFKTIKLVFLTKEDTLDPTKFNIILDVQTYIKEKYKVIIGDQVLLHYGVELKCTENLFELFLKVKNPTTEELRLNLIAFQRPIDVKIVTLRGASFKIKVDKTHTIKMIKDKVSQRTHIPADHFQLFLTDRHLQEEKTLQDYECEIIDCEKITLTLKTVLKIRLHFEDPNEIREETILIDEVSGKKTLHKHLKKIRKKNGLKKREMVLIPDEIGLENRWQNECLLMDLLDYSLDYCIVRTNVNSRICQLM